MSSIRMEPFNIISGSETTTTERIIIFEPYTHHGKGYRILTHLISHGVTKPATPEECVETWKGLCAVEKRSDNALAFYDVQSPLVTRREHERWNVVYSTAMENKDLVAEIRHIELALHRTIQSVEQEGRTNDEARKLLCQAAWDVTHQKVCSHRNEKTLFGADLVEYFARKHAIPFRYLIEHFSMLLRRNLWSVMTDHHDAVYRSSLAEIAVDMVSTMNTETFPDVTLRTSTGMPTHLGPLSDSELRSRFVKLFMFLRSGQAAHMNEIIGDWLSSDVSIKPPSLNRGELPRWQLSVAKLRALNDFYAGWEAEKLLRGLHPRQQPPRWFHRESCRSVVRRPRGRTSGVEYHRRRPAMGYHTELDALNTYRCGCSSWFDEDTIDVSGELNKFASSVEMLGIDTELLPETLRSYAERRYLVLETRTE